MTARMYYDNDADPSALAGQTVAIIGYGSQGHAHALNLHESGVDVVVGLVNSATSRYFRKENGAPAGNADAPRPMPARPPCHADIPQPVASATFPPQTSSAGLQPATP